MALASTPMFDEQFISRFHREDEELRTKWLTPADLDLIEAEVRRSTFASSEDGVQREIRARVCASARACESIKGDLAAWSRRALQDLTGMEVVVPKGATLASFAARIEASCHACEQAALGPYADDVDAKTLALARKWAAATAYVVSRFHAYVVDAVESAARDAAGDLLDGRADGREVALASTSAATRWAAAWAKGEIR